MRNSPDNPAPSSSSPPERPRAAACLGVPLALLDYEQTITEIRRLRTLPRPTAVSFCNTHLVAEANRESTFLNVLKSFDLNLPDGMPLIRLLNLGGAGLKDRVYGPYLMRRFFAKSSADECHFLMGSSDETLARLVKALKQLNPAAQIVGTLSPPFRDFTPADNRAIAEAINQAEPDYVWIALGGVRQETWIAENKARLQGGVLLAVGDAFALLAGNASFAPAWMQRAGLTWLYRLAGDPRRLAARYLRYNLLFLYHFIRAILRSPSVTSEIP